MAGDHRGIDQHVEIDGKEVNFIAGVLGDGKGSTKFPAIGNFEAWFESDRVGGASLGVEQHLVPAKKIELLGGRGARGKTRGGAREQEIEIRFERGYAGGNLQMKGEHFNEVATPGNFFAAGAKMQAG